MRFLKVLLPYFSVVIISVVVAIVVRLFVFDFYTIPSDSMSPSIEPGDFIVVNKLSFGARMYRSFHFMRGKEEPATWRVKGYAPIRHGDVVVFNFPYAGSWDRISMHLLRFYVKRCIGTPGDTLRIRNAFYEINGQQGFGNLTEQQMLSNYAGEFPPPIYNTIPFDHRFDWNILNMGPLYIPREGDQIALDSLSSLLYYKMIAYEKGGEVGLRNSRLYHRDSLVENYTFQKNWYFMGGDFMWNSQDSRYLGLIPEDFIIGKASFVLSSKDPETRKYNWNRFFKVIK